MWWEIFWFVLGGLLGNILSQKLSGKHEGDQSRMKSIIIPLTENRILWVHHWAFYLFNLTILLLANTQSELTVKMAILCFGVGVMIVLLFLAKLLTSLSHLTILLSATIIAALALIDKTLFVTVVGAFVGIILHGLSYKDRFDFIRKL